MMHINSLFRILVSLTIITALTFSSIGLLSLLQPKAVSAEEQQFWNSSSSVVNNKLPKTIMFNLPSKQVIDTNGNQKSTRFI